MYDPNEEELWLINNYDRFGLYAKPALGEKPMFLHEEQITCPYCWETITLLVDPSESQTYTEDCFVCCRPILVNTDIQGDSITVNVAQEDLGF